MPDITLGSSFSGKTRVRTLSQMSRRPVVVRTIPIQLLRDQRSDFPGRVLLPLMNACDKCCNEAQQRSRGRCSEQYERMRIYSKRTSAAHFASTRNTLRILVDRDFAANIHTRARLGQLAFRRFLLEGAVACEAGAQNTSMPGNRCNPYIASFPGVM